MLRISVSKKEKEIGKKFGFVWDINKDGTTKIESIDINTPIFNLRSNCRELEEDRVKTIMKSIKDGGFTSIIEITKIGSEIVNGHHLIEAMKRLGYKNINHATILNKNPNIEEDAWKLACFSFSINRSNIEEGMTQSQIYQFVVRGYKRYNEIFGFNSGNLGDKWNLKSLAFDLDMVEGTIYNYKSKYDKLIKSCDNPIELINKTQREIKDRQEKVTEEVIDEKIQEKEIVKHNEEKKLIKSSIKDLSDKLDEATGFKGEKKEDSKKSLIERIKNQCSKILSNGKDELGGKRKDDTYIEGCKGIETISEEEDLQNISGLNKEKEYLKNKFNSHIKWTIEISKILGIELKYEIREIRK